MEKKKLGLSNKSKLELSKTVEGGTVKQSFSHGRVKSVAVEVKKVRTFKKNENSVKVFFSGLIFGSIPSVWLHLN